MAERNWIKNSAFADLFYPGNPLQLKTAIERFLAREKEIKKVSFLLVPHAGYIYSGSTAGKTYACSEIFERVIILGPNHAGMGKPISVWTKGYWKTPLGEVKIDEEISKELIGFIGNHCEDRDAHLREHSIEVQIPFLQVRYKNFSFVPICVGTENFGDLVKLGKSICEVIKKYDEKITIIVSSDMNHYESAKTNRIKDNAALKEILNLNYKGLYKAVNQKNISMCGYAPCVAAIFALNQMGSRTVEIVDYSHSGMITGEDDEVVSYAGLRCLKEQ